MAAALAAAVSAQVTTNQKIGVIDMQSALVATKEGQKAAADLSAKYAPKQQEFQQRQSQLQQIVQNLSGKMMKIVSKYAQDHQFQLVFDVAGQPSNIYFASNTIDVTRE